MNGTTIQIQSTEPGASTAFDCYLSLPAQATKTPAIVLACAIHGVTKEIRDIADFEDDIDPEDEEFEETDDERLVMWSGLVHVEHLESGGT